jgi:branched-chain amino acid transport system substrate-binding protein
MKGTKKVLFVVLAALLLIAPVSTGAFGCGGGPSVSEWSIPNISITTGPGAAFGLDAAWGVDRAVTEINQAGGIEGKPVKITRYDTAYDPAKAVVAMTQVLGTNPLVIVGPMDDVSIDSSGDLAIKAGVACMSSITTDSRPRFTPWVASLYPESDTYAAIGTEEWLRLNPDIKSVVIFYAPQASSHIRQMAAQEPVLAKLGIKVLAKIECTVGQIDFGPQAVKAIALKPDGYYSHLNVMEEPLLCQALYQRGMTEGRRICCGAGATGGAMFELGKGFLEDTYLWDVYNFASTDPGWLACVAAYKAEHSGQFPYSMAIWGQYEAVYAVKAAFESLKITGDPNKLAQERIAIRDFLWNAKDVHGAQGSTWSWVNGVKANPLFMYQIKNNECKLVNTVTMK